MTWSMLLASLRLLVKKKNREILKASSKRESGLAPLSAGRLPVKMEIRINDEETKRKESRKQR